MSKKSKKSKKSNNSINYRKRKTRKHYKRKSLRNKRQHQRGGDKDVIDFYLYLRSGNVDEISGLLEKRSDLLQIIYSGNRKCLNIVVDPRMIQTTNGYTRSVKLNYVLLKLLLDNGADVDFLDSHGNTPLYTLISNHNIYTNKMEEILKIIELLRKYGADVNNLYDKNIDLFLYPMPQEIITELLKPLPGAIPLNEQYLINIRRSHIENKAGVDIAAEPL
jgi:ankyrin repeat protein